MQLGVQHSCGLLFSRIISIHENYKKILSDAPIFFKNKIIACFLKYHFKFYANK